MGSRALIGVGRFESRSAIACSIWALLLLLIAGASRAELVSNGGFWLMGLGQGSFERIDPRLGRARWWVDAQARFRDDTSGFHQALVRPGLGLSLTEHTSVWLGYAWVRTSTGSGAESDEHRVWQQLLWSRSLRSTAIQLRTRLEQRFLSTGDDTGWRFRQFVKLGRSFGFEPRLSLVGYDEVFFDLNDTDWGQRAGFDQNRLFAGLAWRFDEGGRVIAELGYLNQLVRGGASTNTMNHLLSVNFLLK